MLFLIGTSGIYAQKRVTGTGHDKNQKPVAGANIVVPGTTQATLANDVGKLWGVDAISNSNEAAYADLDNDGDLDLIVNNINKPALIGINNDKKPDLIVICEWMPVSIYINTYRKLVNRTKDYFDKDYNGWWNKLLVGDFNKDGKPDLIVGNLGINSQCKASDEEPAEMYFKDFDNNGSVDLILCLYIQHKSYPYLTRDELGTQIKMMYKRFPDYNSFADATLKDIFHRDELKDIQYLYANHLSTSYFETGTDGKFHEKKLPLEVQFSPFYIVTALDYNMDGNEDLLLCGNIHNTRIRFGNYDANYGILLQGDSKGSFRYITQQESGFHLVGDVRSVLSINNTLMFGINQQEIKCYGLR